MQASEKLWGAAANAIMAVAQQRGLEYGTHRALVNAARQIADEQDDDLLRSKMRVGILAAQQFHSHFYNRTMELEDIEYDRPLVHRYVALMLTLLDQE
ncbi:MAG: hypothetical protein OXF79_23205 [Chloroflexi bacterium]|nr:hypothetical protein [Chloroflexota bacterium]